MVMGMTLKFEKDSPFCFWVFEWYSFASRPTKINGNLYFTQHWDSEISLHSSLIV